MNKPEITRHFPFSEAGVPEDWRDNVVRIWTEDDVPTGDKENTDIAFERIFGRHSHPVAKSDEGDQFVTLYRNGEVKAINCEGGWLGVLVKRPDDDTLWVVGKNTPDGPDSWEFQGVFSNEDLAVEACRDERYFVGKAKLNESLPDESCDWPEAYYPLAKIEAKQR